MHTTTATATASGGVFSPVRTGVRYVSHKTDEYRVGGRRRSWEAAQYSTQGWLGGGAAVVGWMVNVSISKASTAIYLIVKEKRLQLISLPSNNENTYIHTYIQRER